ncbi:hypothetical protein [Bremerella cremea]|uniref:hypothetical protein n=1 Tax=Bremerella cremea TaxID=1031537 RepID=UPI0031E4F644
MFDLQNQMLESLAMLYRFLERPLDGLRESVRTSCLKEVHELHYRTQHHMLESDPPHRPHLLLRQMLDRDAFPLPVAVAAERYLQLYDNEALPEMALPVMDSHFTVSGIPLIQVQNIPWESWSYEGSASGRFLTWAHLVGNADLARYGLAEQIAATGMQPCYEDDTSSLQYKLFSKWNLADSIPQYCAELELSSGVFIALHPNAAATDLLIHMQFMFTSWIEAKPNRREFNLSDAVLNYCREVPADFFAELMPPLAQIVVIDFDNDTLFQFGSDLTDVARMLRNSQTQLT